MMTLRTTLFALLFCGTGLAQSAPAGERAPAASRAGQAGADDGAGSQLAIPSMLRLLDGELLFGSIVGHSPEVLVFSRLENGGIARVPWRLLDPSQSEELQTRFGYIDRSNEELMIEAERLLVGGDEVVGKIVSREGDDIVVKTASRLVYVPKLRIQGAPTVIQVPALDVYTKDELYAQELARLGPETASGHIELAQYCERILAFDKALEHWKQAQQAEVAGLVGGSYDVDLESAAALAGQKAEAQAELDHLQEIDSLRARKRYDEALAHCELFPLVYPESRLLPELQKKRARVERAREEALSEEVARSWHRWAGKLARQAARTMGLDEAIAYLDGQMSEDIQQQVLADVRKRVGESVQPDDVLNAWVNREPGRWRKASYGNGTWLIGEGRAHAGLQEERETQAAGTTPRTDEEQALADKIKRYLENQKTARSAQTGGGDEEERLLFWKIFPLNAKEGWILAHYAEASGDMQLRKPIAHPCASCAGTGVREVLYVGAGTSAGRESGRSAPRSQKTACPTCHYVGIVRRVSFR